MIASVCLSVCICTEKILTQKKICKEVSTNIIYIYALEYKVRTFVNIHSSTGAGDQFEPD